MNSELFEKFNDGFLKLPDAIKEFVNIPYPYIRSSRA